MRDFQVYVEDIVDAIDCIEEYTEELTFERFVKDKKTVDAVVRNLENLGKKVNCKINKLGNEYLDQKNLCENLHSRG